ncbi:MAG: hypothetical protein IPH39_05300 [Sulfuritalea sp.]|nr:hypothetical protein [Sulfuritalea sp.]
MLVTIVGALMLLGPFNLAGSRLPDGLYGAFASHWQAGQATDCSLCPEKLFVVVCDADKRVHLRSMRQLATLQAEQRRGWGSEQAAAHSCIGGRGFRLAQTSGAYGAAYDDDDPGFRFDVSFRVIRDSAAAQVVEVRFRDRMPDIDEALFLYEATDGAVKPLESWVVTRGHRALAMVNVVATVAALLLAWLLYYAIRALRRFLKARRQAG